MKNREGEGGGSCGAAAGGARIVKAMERRKPLKITEKSPSTPAATKYILGGENEPLEEEDRILSRSQVQPQEKCVTEM